MDQASTTSSAVPRRPGAGPQGIRRRRLRWFFFSVLAVSVIASTVSTPAQAITGGVTEADQGKQVNAAYVTIQMSWNRDSLPGRELASVCSGTLISADVVLTAQHCTFGGKKGVTALVPGDFGVVFSATAAAKASKVKVTAVERLPGFNPKTLFGDVALLRLSRPVEGVRPMALSASSAVSQDRFTAYGFGRVDAEGGSPVVKKAEQQKVSWGDAIAAAGACGALAPQAAGETPRTEGEASFSYGLDGALQHGDSGGPAVAPIAGGYAVADILSGSVGAEGVHITRPCARPSGAVYYGDVLSLFTRVDGSTPAGRWIQQEAPTVAFLDPIASSGTQAPAANGTLFPGQRLESGTRLTSASGLYSLTMETSGDLVLRSGEDRVWSSGTSGNPGAILVNQPDGNLVIIATGNRPIWSTGTQKFAGSVLQVQDDRNLVVYSPGHIARWASRTAVR